MYITGQRVKMNEAGHIAYGEGGGNPRGVIGTVVEPNEWNEPKWSTVEWDNGQFNDYEAGTLDVVEG